MNITEDEKRLSLTGKIKLFFKNEYFTNKINIWLIVLTIIANTVNWGAILFFIRPTDHDIILHYNVYFGVDATGNWKSVFMLPAIGLALFVINFFLSIHLYSNKERVASYILLSAAFMAQLSLLIASLSVIIINY